MSSKYPTYLLRRVAVHTTGPVYYERYSSAQTTFAAYMRAKEEGDAVDYLAYLYPDSEQFCEDRGIYYGQTRNYSVPHEMIIDRRD
jgi:hypothetical protein